MSKIIHSGRVVDESGQPLVGAHVLTVNSNPKRGVITDANGNFSVDGSLHEVFEIGFLGFESQIFRLDKYMGKQTYRLKEDAYELDGYTGTPSRQLPPKVDRRTDTELWNIFGGIADGILTNANVFTPIQARQAQFKVETTSNGPVLFTNQIKAGDMAKRVPTPETPKGGFKDWLNNNPLTAGGLLLGALAIGTYYYTNN